MEIKSEIEVSIIEHINSSNVDGAIDNIEVCKFEEDEVVGPIDKGEGHPNEDIIGVEDSNDDTEVEEIDTFDRRAARKNSSAIALEESKQKIDLSDIRFYGRHRGRSTRSLKRINYSESAESDKGESIPKKMKSPKGKRLSVKKPERKFKCDKCSYAATDKHKLKRHKQIHNTTNDYRCDICDFTTNTGDKLRNDSE